MAQQHVPVLFSEALNVRLNESSVCVCVCVKK